MPTRLCSGPGLREGRGKPAQPEAPPTPRSSKTSVLSRGCLVYFLRTAYTKGKTKNFQMWKKFSVEIEFSMARINS